MEPNDLPGRVKTPDEIAEEAKQASRDALLAAQGYATEAKALGKDTIQSIRPRLEEAKATGREALDTARGIAGDAKDIAGDAADTGKVYARAAVNKAGKKIVRLKDQVHHAQDACTKYIADEPVKSVLISAAIGAGLTALLIAWINSERVDRRYYY